MIKTCFQIGDNHLQSPVAKLAILYSSTFKSPRSVQWGAIIKKPGPGHKVVGRPRIWTDQEILILQVCTVSINIQHNIFSFVLNRSDINVYICSKEHKTNCLVFAVHVF